MIMHNITYCGRYSFFCYSDHGDSVVRLMVQLEEMERKSQQLKHETSLVLRHVKVKISM